jgi:hypothetical protein
LAAGLMDNLGLLILNAYDILENRLLLQELVPGF